MIVVLSGRPLDSAASMVNILNVEPNWNPPSLSNGSVVAGKLPMMPALRLAALLFCPLWLWSLLYVRLTAMTRMYPVLGSTPASMSASGLFVDRWARMFFVAEAWALTSSDVMILYPPLFSRFSRS